MGPSARQMINLVLFHYSEKPFAEKSDRLQFDLRAIRGDANYRQELSHYRSWLALYGYDHHDDGLRHSAGRFGKVTLIYDMKEENIPYEWVFLPRFFQEMRPARNTAGALVVKVILYWDDKRMIEMSGDEYFRSLFWHEPITYD